MRIPRTITTLGAAAAMLAGSACQSLPRPVSDSAAAKAEVTAQKINACLGSDDMMKAAVGIAVLQRIIRDDTPLPIGKLAFAACADTVTRAESMPASAKTPAPTQQQINTAAANELLPLAAAYESLLDQDNGDDGDDAAPATPIIKTPYVTFGSDLPRPQTT